MRTLALFVPLHRPLRKYHSWTNQPSEWEGSFLYKVLLPVLDFSLDYELVQYQYDRWLFKTITGAINSSRASGCSPNTALQQKSFSTTYWHWQHLYLLDVVRQFGFPSFFVTISPYQWTFPWPRFIEEIRQEHCLEPTDLPLLETLHVAYVLEQVARGYLTRANSNRWCHHVLNNQEQPAQSNLLTYFYRMEFQSRGTLHLHMLVWVKDLSLIRANLLHASIPWGNRNDAFLVADIQKSSSSCLPLCAEVRLILCDQNARGRHRGGTVLHRRHRLPGRQFLPEERPSPGSGDGVPAIQHEGGLDRQADEAVPCFASRSGGG